jgi:hypothetical protein
VAADGALPQDALENHILRFWQRLLARTDVAVDDDFFAVGGTRELAGWMLTTLAPVCGEKLCLADFDGTMTVRRLADLALSRTEMRAARTGVAPLPPGPSVATPPQDVLQDRLAALWEALLDRTNIGIDDDFFALGGTQELAECMIAAVEQLCAEPIPLGDRAGGLTVRALADRLVAALPASLLIQVQSGSVGVPPFFLLHGDLGGGGYYVRELARELGPERPVYALAQHGMQGEDVPSSIEEMAADHARNLSLLYPDGPLHLGGHCAGATIAWEVAQCLVRRHRPIASLILIEPPIRVGDGPVRTLPPPRLSATARRTQRVRVPWLLSEYATIVPRYRYQPYAGRVVVFWAGGGAAHLDSPERRAALRALAPQIAMHTCPGDHVTALGRHLKVLASELRGLLLSADALRT